MITILYRRLLAGLCWFCAIYIAVLLDGGMQNFPTWVFY